MVHSSQIRNKTARKEAYTSEKSKRNAAKLKRRMALRKAELEDPSLRDERLRTNVPITIENSKEWVGAAGSWRRGGAAQDEVEDRRTMPVQLVDGDTRLDMAGLEDLFPDEEPLGIGPTPSTSAQDPDAPRIGGAQDATVDETATHVEQAAAADPDADVGAEPASEPAAAKQRGLVLVTTAPHPSDETIAFANEFASLLGGPKYAQIVPRRTARFETSKICKWASKRGYSALVVMGEDHREPSSMTICKLPLGPSAHFRLTSIFLSKEIDNHGNPTSHAPELVLSNMATPLGLSIGRLLGALFPPSPQVQGRQVVAVHNQRDYIFLRRYRYMFAVRGESELEQQRAKERGMDATVRTRMQEIGPRLTLKLRWLKRGTLETGRRKASGKVIGADQVETVTPDDDDARITEYNPDAADDTAPEIGTPGPEGEAALDADTVAAPPVVVEPKKRNKKPRTQSKKGGIRIPKLGIPEASLPGERDNYKRKKRKAGDSILEGVYLQGGMADDALEWQWNPRMSIKKRKHFL